MVETPSSARVARRPDPRRWIYVGLDLLFVIGYVVGFGRLMPNRHGWVTLLLDLLPAATALMAAGTALARPWSWWPVIAGGAVMLAWAIGAMFIVLYFATYLSGVYGAFGQAASVITLVTIALVIQLVAMLPVFQLKWCMTRGGRRTFGLAPLWRSPRERAASASAAAAASLVKAPA